MTQPDWIAAECGPAQLRLWQMAPDDSVLEQASLPPVDAAGLAQAVASAWPDLPGATPVVVSGAGALPYPAVPCKPAGIAQATEQGPMRLLPGLAQEKPADTLEHEATRVAGFLALNPGFDGVICLPGAQSRWVHVSAGEIVSFRSFLTGRLHALLADASLVGFDKSAPWDEATGLEAVDRAMGRPANFAGDLAAIAAEVRLHGLSAGPASARALGLLIGLELAAAKPYWLGQSVALVADGAEAQPYRAALEAQAVPVVVADGIRMAREGLRAAYRDGAA